MTIVQSGDLIAEDMRKKSNRLFMILVVSLFVNYFVFCVVVFIPTQGAFIIQVMNA